MRTRLSIPAGLLLVGLMTETACMSYKQIGPAELDSYEEIRVTTTAGRRENLWDAGLHADTLSGRRASGDTIRIPLGNVQDLRGAETDTGKTVLLVVGVASGVALLIGGIVLVALSDEDCLVWCE